MVAPDEPGPTKRDSLRRQLQEAARKGRAAKVAEIEADLEVPEFPQPLTYLWRTYHRLRRRMAGGFAGPNPIGWQDIDAFVRLTEFRLAPWEIEALEAIDDAYLQSTMKQQRARASKGQDVAESASMSDSASVKALMRNWQPKKKAKSGKR